MINRTLSRTLSGNPASRCLPDRPPSPPAFSSGTGAPTQERGVKRKRVETEPPARQGAAPAAFDRTAPPAWSHCLSDRDHARLTTEVANDLPLEGELDRYLGLTPVEPQRLDLTEACAPASPPAAGHYRPRPLLSYGRVNWRAFDQR